MRNLPRMPGRLVLMIVALWAALAAPALAQVTLSFYGHEGNRIRGGFLYFPHAYVGFSGALEATGEPVDQMIGFTARDPGPQLMFMGGRGLLSEPDPVYKTEGILYLSVQISDETYHALQAEIALWREGPGSRYSLRRRNCIHFAAVMARIAGLDIPSTDTLSPNGFMKEMVELNPQPVQAAAEITASSGAEGATAH